MPKLARAWSGFLSLPETESALTACRWVARTFRGEFRPLFDFLFIQGETGSGKTHLATALAKQIPNTSLVSARDLARNEDGQDYGAPPLLIVEDVQRLPVAAVERLVTLLDAREARRRMTVVTSTESPFDLGGLPRRLTSRLGGGLSVSIRPLSPESRFQFLRYFSFWRQWKLSDEVVRELAERPHDGCRDLIGAAEQWAAGRKNAVERRIGRVVTTPKRPEDKSASFVRTVDSGKNPLDDVVAKVAKVFGVSADDICGQSQLPTISTARFVVIFIAKEKLEIKNSLVAKYLNRNLSSLHTVPDSLRWKMIRDPALTATVNRLADECRADYRKLVAQTSREGDGMSREST